MQPIFAERVLIGFGRFLGAESWGEAKRVLEETPELLYPVAYEILELGVDDAGMWFRDEVPEEDAKQRVKYHLFVLKRCQELGVEEAFKQLHL